jgi:biopolymer transport protein ExbD
VITRPLDLLSQLRPPPRNYDFLFLVNGGLIALFFALFGSHYVLSPGLRVDNKDITLQTSTHALDNPVATPVSVSVDASGQICGDTGLIAPSRLKEWMTTQVKRAPGSVLLVIMDTRASMEVFTTIAENARAVGFSSVQMAMQQAPATEAQPPR